LNFLLSKNAWNVILIFAVLTALEGKQETRLPYNIQKNLLQFKYLFQKSLSIFLVISLRLLLKIIILNIEGTIQTKILSSI